MDTQAPATLDALPGGATPAAKSPAANAVKAKKNGTGRKLILAMILVPLIGVAVVESLRYMDEARHFETTDDAFVDGHVSQVASQVAGRVKTINAADNQLMAAGQLLLTIDPADYDVRTKQAEAQRAASAAQLEQAKAQLDLQQANAGQAAANLRVAESDALQAGQDFARYSSLGPQAVSRQEVDRSSASAKSSAARVDASRSSLIAAQAQLSVAKAQIDAAAAMLAQSDAQLENAKLQASYTQIVAPVAGRVTKRSVEVGNYINPGQALLAIVPPDLYVTANFKESQLAGMQPGQPVDIHIDAYPAETFKGHVDSFQTGTGSAFSSLPAENATGNYVKVVQRLPVKIVFDGPLPEGVRLAPGFSVVPKVRVRTNGG